MLTVSDQQREKVQKAYSKRPSIAAGPSRIPHKRTIHPRRVQSKLYLVMSVTACERLRSRGKPNNFLLPITESVGKIVMQSKYLLEEAADKCERLNQIRLKFGHGLWTDHYAQLETDLVPEEMTIPDEDVSEFETWEMTGPVLYARKASHPSKHADECDGIFCRIEAHTDESAAEAIKMKTQEFKPFKAVPKLRHRSKP